MTDIQAVDARGPKPGGPTGLAQMRQRLIRYLKLAFHKASVDARHVLGDPERLALQVNPVETFSSWLTTRHQQAITGVLPNVESILTRAYAHGAARAAYEVGQRPVSSTLPTLTAAVRTELVGISAAVIQKASREYANGLLAHSGPPAMARAISSAYQGGIDRLSMLAEYFTMKAFTAGALDVYAAAGVTHVDTVPELMAPRRVATDAVTLSKTTFKVPKAPKYSKPTREQLRAERRLERTVGEGEVDVKTAGDDRVCPVCQKISDNGPYLLDRARSLIPAHPRCRCELVPAE